MGELRARNLEVIGDSQVVIKQLKGEYRCTSPNLQGYLQKAAEILCQFRDVELNHRPREENMVANDLAQLAFDYKEPSMADRVTTFTRLLPSIYIREPMVALVGIVRDWRQLLVDYLSDPGSRADFKTKKRALRYCLLDGQLYKKMPEEVLLKCLGAAKVLEVMAETHEGLCGSHLAGRRLRWAIKHLGYYWPTMHEDCINYAKGCQECQFHGPIQRVPASEMHAIIKPWSFRGWAMDLMVEVQPNSSA